MYDVGSSAKDPRKEVSLGLARDVDLGSLDACGIPACPGISGSDRVAEP